MGSISMGSQRKKSPESPVTARSWLQILELVTSTFSIYVLEKKT